MIQLFLEPMDVWLFRDGRPFDAGAQHRAESVFPPFPSVIAGAVRSYQLARKGIKLSAQSDREKQIIIDTVGTADDLKDLRISGPFLVTRDPATKAVTRFYPQPADAYTCRIDQTTKEVEIRPATPPRLKPSGTLTSRSSPETDEFLMGLEDPLEKGVSGVWVSEEDLKNYLKGSTVWAIPETNLLMREIHPGIGMENAPKRAQEGMLFEVEFVRLQPNVGLLIGIEGDSYKDWPESGIVQLGGENRAAAFEKLTPPLSQLLDIGKDEHKIKDRIKVYFATSAWFSGGWQPLDGWDSFFKDKVVLRAAAVSRFISLGGFDLAKSEHKASKRYVPAGSVYYFEAVDGTPIELKEKCFTEIGQEFGLGQIITGVW